MESTIDYSNYSLDELIQARQSIDAETIYDVPNLMLEEGLDVDDNAEKRYGWTALMEATQWGHCELVALLLARGANMDLVDNLSHKTALHDPASKGYEESTSIY